MSMSHFLRRLSAALFPSTDYPSGAILLASDALPTADQDSGSLRMTMIIKGLSSFGMPLIYLSFRDLPDLPGNLGDPDCRLKYEANLAELGVGKIIYGPKRAQMFLKKHGGALKLAFVAFPHVAASLMQFLRCYAPDAILAYDMVDFHAIRIRREAELIASESKMDEAKKMELLEASIFSASDVVFAVSELERQEVKRIVPAAEVHVISNGFDIRDVVPPGPRARRNIAFIGGFWHRPNVDAVQWFTAEVWPLIRQRDQNVEFHIAGSNADDSVYALQDSDGVRVLGYVEDLSGFFDEHRVFVAPLRYGAGVKGKVGQSMAYGLPVVTTPIGAEGMNVTDGIELMIRETPAEVASAVLSLLTDDAQWSLIQANAIRYAVQAHSPELINAVLKEALGQELYAAGNAEPL